MDLGDFDGEQGYFEAKNSAGDKEFDENETQTSDIEYWERGTRMQQMKSHRIQTEESTQENIDESQLGSFLENTLQRMLNQLSKQTEAFQCNFNLDFDVNWEDQNSVNQEVHFLDSPVQEEEISTQDQGEDFFSRGEKVATVQLRAAQFDWNCKGTTLGIGYCRNTHQGWCSHRGILRVWNCFREPKAKEFEVEGCITSVSFHPNYPQILATGNYNGQITLWDFEKSDPIVTSTGIDEYLHREAVTELIWHSTISRAYLYSLSTDGKILHWDGKLRYLLRGFLIRVRSTLEGGLGFSVVKDDISTMIIGTESGKVLKANLPDMNTTKIPTDRIRWRTDAMLLLCNSSQAGKHHVRNIAEKYAVDTGRKEVDAACIFASKPDIVKLYPNSVSFVYERQEAPVVKVSCNYFSRNLIATASLDGGLRFYHMLHSKVVQIREPDRSLNTVEFSPHRPLVVAAGGQSGNVFLYDLADSEKELAILQADLKAEVTYLRFNKYHRGFLAVGYSNGVVKVYQLASGLCSQRPDEFKKMTALLEEI